jgi:hypothetical protein
MSARTRKLTEKGKAHAIVVQQSKLAALKNQDSKKQNQQIDDLANLMGSRMKLGGKRRKTRRRSRK